MESTFPSFAIMLGQHQFPFLESKLKDLTPIESLSPFAPEGRRGFLGDIPIAIFRGLPGSEMNLVPVIRSPAKFFFVLAVAGGLQPNIERGDILIPSASIRGEGLTQYYARADFPAVIDLDVGYALMKAANHLDVKTRTGLFYTTASMYKEPEYIRELQELGIIAIEMELAQFYLLAQLEGKKAGAIYVTSDNPIRGDKIWEEGVNRDITYSKNLDKAAEVICEAIKELDKQT